ncbi:MAG TPA: hypothetical protein VMS65_00285, partial [Polyangiaceae bacterium]|nr:hypothetical protein [Polyangiaceae bacterium]
MSDGHSHEPALPPIDVREHGAVRDGVPQVLDRRLFMQLLVFTCGRDLEPSRAVVALGRALAGLSIGSVVYEDVNDPRGFGVLSFSEDPAEFVTKIRPALASPELAALSLRPEFTMLGRSYASGFEADLEHWVLKRPRETVLNEEWPWAVWYP